MPPFLRSLFDVGYFMPHGHCYLWNRRLVWLHLLSDTSIGLAYVIISLTLVYLVMRARREIPFHWMFLAFGLFIVACGGTHFMEVWTLWTPLYWLAGAIKAITAVASVGTAVLLPPLVPRALRLLHAAQASEERKRQLERLNTELEDLYEARRQFFANVSHELRTPLGLVLGPAEKLLAESSLTGSQRQSLEVISRNARTLLKHVNDLLDVSKLEAGGMRPAYTEVDLSRLVRWVAAHFDALAEERKIVYVIETPAALPAQVDAEKVQRIVLNLLSNAFKFAPQGGAIRCIVEPEPDGAGPMPEAREERSRVAAARISVRDSGPGVPVELRGVIFQRFRQGEGGATRRFGGTGLGLAIVKEFVELHGGSVAVAEAPEGGAGFVVTLPLTAPVGAAVGPQKGEDHAALDEMAQLARAELSSDREPGVAAPVVPGANEGTPPSGEAEPRALVLVVEDNREMNRFLVETLSADYRVASALNGREGLEKAVALRPDLILSDVMMPEMSGDQLLREVRSCRELDSVPFVHLSARADDELRVGLLRRGAQDYLLKPFSSEELRARVGNLVSMKRARELLQQELATHLHDLEGLATEVGRRRRELQIALEAMRVARDHAERASQVKTHFLRLVSHELRTPLATLQLQLQLLQRNKDGDLSPRQLELVQRLSTSSRRLHELIESLLEHARFESGRLTLSIEPFELTDLAGEVVEELREQAEQKQLALTLIATEALPPLQSDPRLVRLVLVNLVGNALKYTSSGAIEVTIAPADNRQSIAVRDTGPGIAPEQQAGIFEPFAQVEPLAHKHTPGVGLGLTIVREMVTALGGEIGLVSCVGEGSTFTVLLPSRDSG